jgi:hypothetical protein
MAELPESLKKYLPGPILLLVSVAWWIFNEPIQKWVQEEITHAPVQVRVEDRANNLYVIRAEATRYSDKAFEDVQLDLELRSKPDDISGELVARNGNHEKLAIEPKKSDPSAFLIETTVGPTPAPITLQPREDIEIDLHEPTPKAVKEVWFYAKDRIPVSAFDLNQHWPLAKFAWRFGLAVFGISACFFLYKLLLRLLSRKALKTLDEEREFLHRCFQADTAARARFDSELQPIIDSGVAKYLKILNPVVSNKLRKPLIAEEIFRRARSLPKFRRSLKGEVQSFVIEFCIDFLEHELDELKKIAESEKARIR